MKHVVRFLCSSSLYRRRGRLAHGPTRGLPQQFRNTCPDVCRVIASRAPAERFTHVCEKSARISGRSHCRFVCFLLSHVIVVFLVVDAFALVIFSRLDIVLLIRADVSVCARLRFLVVDMSLATLQAAGLAIGQLS